MQQITISLEKYRRKEIHTNTQLCDNFPRREADTNMKAEKFILAPQCVSVLPWVSKN